MPTYLYLCDKPIEDGGHGEFEEYHSVSIKLEECPLCKKEKDVSTPVQRLICGVSKGVVELTGRDAIDKAKADAQAYKKEVYSSESKYASIIGENRYQEIQQRMDRNRR